MTDQRQPQVITVPIDRVRPWKDNPRQVKKGDFDRLKKQILELGFYKALLATEDPDDPGAYIVLGGNTRLRALKDLGWTEVGLTIVNAPTDDAKLKYNLSDNDQVGAWDDQALAEIAFRTRDKIQNLDIFKIDLGNKVSLPRTSSSAATLPNPRTTPASSRDTPLTSSSQTPCTT